MRTSMLAALALLGGMSQALAQDAPPLPPVVADLAEGYEFPEGRPIEILGVTLGQKREEAVAALKEAYPGLEVIPTAQVVGVSDGQGHEVAVLYNAKDTVTGTTADGVAVWVQLVNTTGVSTERVAQIARTEDYTDEPDLEPMLEALKAKYGPPSAEGGLAGSYVDLEWAWSADGFNRTGSDLAECDHYSAEYQFNSDRVNQAGACAAWLRARLWYGQSEAQMKRLEMTAASHRRSWDNAVATDQWLGEEVERIAASSGAPAQPGL